MLCSMARIWKLWEVEKEALSMWIWGLQPSCHSLQWARQLGDSMYFPEHIIQALPFGRLGISSNIEFYANLWWLTQWTMSNCKLYFIFYQLLHNWRGGDAQLTSRPRHQPVLPEPQPPKTGVKKEVASHWGGASILCQTPSILLLSYCTLLPIESKHPSPSVTDKIKL